MQNQESSAVYLTLFIGTAVIFVLALAIIFFVILHQRRVIAHQDEMRRQDEKNQQELLRATILTQEEEQRRISRDLHDDVGPLLSAVKLKIEQLRRQMKDQGLEATNADSAKQMLDDGITQVRNISHRLLPPALEDYGLASALEQLCQKINSSDDLVLSFNEEGVSDKRLDKETELALYRVCMELVNNVIKHSGAKNARIEIATSDNKIELSVEDDGKGFDPAGVHNGLGIKSIQSRLKAINSSIQYQQLPKGMKALVTVHC